MIGIPPHPYYYFEWYGLDLYLSSPLHSPYPFDPAAYPRLASVQKPPCTVPGIPLHQRPSSRRQLMACTHCYILFAFMAEPHQAPDCFSPDILAIHLVVATSLHSHHPSHDSSSTSKRGRLSFAIHSLRFVLRNEHQAMVEIVP